MGGPGGDSDPSTEHRKDSGKFREAEAREGVGHEGGWPAGRLKTDLTGLLGQGTEVELYP